MTKLFLILLLAPFIQSESKATTDGHRWTQMKTITVSFWCSTENQIILVEAFNSLGYEVREHPRKDGDPLAVVGREYLNCESFEGGRIVLYVVTPDCDTNGEFKLAVVWKSELSTPEEVVRNFLRREKWAKRR
jgi:hypothetical protein